MNTRGEEYDMKRTAELVNIGKLKLFKILRESKVLNSENLPYIKYRQLGYFRIHTSRYVHEVRGEMARSKTVVTPLGIEFINKLLNDYLTKGKDQKTEPAKLTG